MKTTNKYIHAGINDKRSTWLDDVMSTITFAEEGEARTARGFLDRGKRALLQRRKTDEQRVIEMYLRRMYS